MRWRYYCDFCKKSGGNSLREHEKHCVGNPNRECRMCIVIERITGEAKGQQPIADLMDALFTGGMDAIRALADNCPACILAAIFQLRKKIGPADAFRLYDDKVMAFDFKAESAKLFAAANEYEEANNAYGAMVE